MITYNKNDLISNLGQVVHLSFLHLEIEKSETSELPFANNQEGIFAPLRLSTTALTCWKFRDLLGGLTPKEVVKSVDITDFACNRVKNVKS